MTQTQIIMDNAEQSSGHVMEIFNAIQGEGPWVGIPQVFFRLFRCNLRCHWCDTPESFELTGVGQVEDPPSSRSFTKFENPISPKRALELLEPFLGLPHHSISFTGGEPLIQKQFLRELFALLKNRHEKIFLETGGSLPDHLKFVLEDVDYISMDLKLPSSTLERQLWKDHEAFLKLAVTKECYIKLIVTQNTTEVDLLNAFHLIQRIQPELQVILQPVTPINTSVTPSEAQMLQWQTLALRYLPNVRVIPQVHKLMGQR